MRECRILKQSENFYSVRFFLDLTGEFVRDEAVKYTLDSLHFAASGNNASSNKPLSSLGGLFLSMSHSEKDTHSHTHIQALFFRANCFLFC